MTYQSRRPVYRYRTPPVPSKGSLLYKQMTRKEFLLTAGALIAGVVVFYLLGHHHNTTPAGSLSRVSSSPKTGGHTSTPAPAAASFNKQQYSLSDPNSIWLVVNKHRPLNPLKFVPSDLVVPNIPLRGNITGDEKYVSAKMAAPLERMVADAKAANINLNLQSGYRSYNFQVNLYNGYVRQQGRTAADAQSAHPGYSEHQTGLAADLGGTSTPACDVAQCFADTVEGKWLAANAYRYGFIVRYTADKQAITGYEYEPWHVRYVGNSLAAEMHNQSIETLEEFFNLGPAPSY